jgi:hypothetical protein
MAVQNYWGNQSYAANQQAQYAGMPQQQNYQSPSGTQVQAPNQQQAWAAPTQGSWGSSPSQPTSQPRPSSAPAPANWGQWQPAPQQAQTGGGGGGGGASGYPGPGAPSGTTSWAQPVQPSQGGGDPYALMSRWYQQYLGRTPSRAEMDSYLQHGTSMGNLQTYQQQIQASQEAAAYQAAAQAGMQQGLPPSWWQQGGGGGGPMPGNVTPGNMNTDGYRPPQFVAQAAGGPMPGWDASKWNDPGHQTPKYVVGRILSHFAPRTSNMAQVVQAIAQAYPGTRQVGAGDISIPGIGTTDILQSAGAGGKAWQFLGSSGGGGGGPMQPTGGAPDYMTMYMQMLQSLQQPQQNVAQPMRAAGPDVSQYTSQIQQLQTQLAELQSQNQQRRGLNVTYF